MHYALTAIKILAAMVISTAVAFSLLLVSTPEASASSSYPTHLKLNSNLSSFKNQTAPYYGISGKAYRWAGSVPKGLSGSASLYVNGKHQRTRSLDYGWFGFRISRAHLPDNQQVKVTVKVHPRNSDFQSRTFHRWITDEKSSAGEKVVAAAKSQVGDSYRLGSEGPSSWDCSSLTQYAVKKATGKTIPRTSAAQKDAGRRVSAADARPGDLLYVPGHMAVYAGHNKVVEAANPSTGVVYRQIWQSRPTFIRVV